jgi:hypothetical protein
VVTLIAIIAPFFNAFVGLVGELWVPMGLALNGHGIALYATNRGVLGCAVKLQVPIAILDMVLHCLVFNLLQVPLPSSRSWFTGKWWCSRVYSCHSTWVWTFANKQL